MIKKQFFCIVIALVCGMDIFAQSKGRTQSANKTGIRSVDFHNLAYNKVDVNDKSVKLRKGRNLVKGEYTPDSPYYGSEINTIKYLDFDGDGKEEALVVLDYTLEQAGAYWVQHYFIFTYRNGKAQEIFHESRYKSSGFRLSGKSLIVMAPYWKDDDGHCCPSLDETATYAWRGTKFSRISQKFKPWK